MSRFFRAGLPALVLALSCVNVGSLVAQSDGKRQKMKEQYEESKQRGCGNPYAFAGDPEAFGKAAAETDRCRADSKRLEERRARLRERLGTWLWVVPLSVLACVVLVAARGEPVKAWIGRLHGGQVSIFAGALMIGGFFPLAAT